MLLRKIFLRIKNFRNINLSACSTNIEGKPPKEDLKSLLDNAASFDEKHPVFDKWTRPLYVTKVRNPEPLRTSVDPLTTSAILFPGQGTQYVGMAKELIAYPNVMDLFDCASEILKHNLLDLCIRGPIDMLNRTVHSQVAVMVSSLAAVEKLRSDNIKMIENCAATAGFSVGEYTALVFAGAIEFESAIKLLQIRGEAMQAASDLHESGMMTVFLTTQANINYACKCAVDWCKKEDISDPVCRVAVHLFPHCKVVAGHIQALKYLESKGQKFGIKKMKHISVSGAFHTPLMLPAKPILKEALKYTAIEAPIIPVYANVDGKPYVNTNQIREKLVEQLCAPVAWEQTMHTMFQRRKGSTFPNTLECGPGKSLRTLLKVNNNEAYKKSESIMA